MTATTASTPEAAHEEPSLLSARVLVPFLLVSLIWGSTWLVIKDQISSVPPTWSVSYRFGVAALGMFVLACWRKAPLRLDRQGQMIALALGFFQFSANFNFVYRSELYITSGLLAVLFAMLMVPNALLSRVFLGQRIAGGFVVGTIVALAGIALLFVQEYRVMPADLGDVMMGLGLALCGIMSASIANVMQSAERVRTMPILTLLAWAMLWGALGNAALGWALYGPPVFESRPAYLGGILYLGLMGSVVTFPLYFALIRDIGAARAAYSSVLVPVVAMILSTLFEGYRWSTLAAAGAALGMIGLVIAMRARSPRTPRLTG
ncbi:DMT family transporter [Sphingomonas sp. 35-24ZXX]|uniref:DMT family transporter n=1 Tax=Sphingomonas sp. 35-24ZXX TaxID=1545915 RepID=UPI0009DF058E|nr:EamA family transporter [Sphingomonas sp. 35-24ZXX]